MGWLKRRREENKAQLEAISNPPPRRTTPWRIDPPLKLWVDQCGQVLCESGQSWGYTESINMINLSQATKIYSTAMHGVDYEIVALVPGSKYPETIWHGGRDGVEEQMDRIRQLMRGSSVDNNEN